MQSILVQQHPGQRPIARPARADKSQEGNAEAGTPLGRSPGRRRHTRPATPHAPITPAPVTDEPAYSTGQQQGSAFPACSSDTVGALEHFMPVTAGALMP